MAPQRTSATKPPQTPPQPAEGQAETGSGSGTGLPSGADLARATDAQGTAATAVTPASAASAPLKLTLPPRQASPGPSMTDGVLNDARSNIAPKPLESRLAAVMGDGRWTMESLGEGRKRYRRGAQCIETRPARGNQIDPFNAAVRNAPELVGAC
jgi:hypothetical protein